MLRQSILRWTSLIAVPISITLIFMSIAQRDTTQAAIKTAPQTQGSLQAINQSGKPAGECPLKHTSVKAEVSGFLSRVTVTQQFQNPFSEKIEAVYTFPLPESAAVDDLTMIVGERTIKGKIMRREEAQAAYSNAKQMGQVAGLLDQERPNIFTQSLANIMPGQEIRITISYVETLKYEDGSYEWVFPMVVGPRYIPGSGETPDTEPVPDAARITPASIPKGMRGGHDISLELALEAGVPIDALTSETHETEMERPDNSRAVVRLRDQDVIPNKDFVLKYQVAGNGIEDAVLAHRSRQGGFFTLILQPPQRVSAEDVMPKELVFVLDTSGSMAGFPLEKAKETMKIALDNLYPHDTFNVITFSGDTNILFPEPVPATKENLRKAWKFLESRKSDGGTEMMKAINAALEPSDSQQHVRIACFMTDGQVGDDFSIIAKVKKYANARIFAMGFGSAPNRFLLGKMAEYGRGEVDYVPESGDTSAVARRFNERIRNPLLTDITVDWSGLGITDVYPKQIPDLFDVKPVILAGRYTSAANGTIKLKGKMAGQNFVREIRVELPETESSHDVLATLWARRRIDDLMSQDMEGLQNGKMLKAAREEIAQLGLSFKLMTQFTSFLAIDDVMFTPGGEPTRVDVPGYDPASGISASVSASVTVTGGAYLDPTDNKMQVSITGRSLQDLPLQGRSFLTLTSLAPGVTPALDIAVNGQRSTSNSFLIDGVSANFGIVAGGHNPGASAAGTSPAFTASGGANGLATLSATQEVAVHTQYGPPEFGRVPGAQVVVTTRPGSNEFHGSLFHYFGNDVFDAADWFANSRGLKQPPRRLNNFGGTFAGPITKDKIFFFGSYEGLRLRQPMTALSEVPSLDSRRAAPFGVREFLDAYPLPNGKSRPDGFSEFAASFSNPAHHDIGSIRVDANLTNADTITGKYTFAESSASQRGAGGFSLNTTNTIRSLSQTLNGSVTHTLSPTVLFDVHASYSRLSVNGSYDLDNFGGATVPALSDNPFSFDLNGRNSRLMTAGALASVQKQLNIVGTGTIISGNHAFKFGSDYRRLSPIIRLRTNEQSGFFEGVEQSLTGVATRVSFFNRTSPQLPVFSNLSVYGQDEWRATPKLTLTYGVRWELNPAPGAGDQNALAVDQVDDLSQMRLAPRGTPLWQTTYVNVAPRFGFAYELSNDIGKEFILRGGLGVFYDTGQERAGDAFADSLPFLNGASIFNVPFPTLSPASNPGSLPLEVFAPNLKLPYVVRWNASLQRSLGPAQAIGAAYVGSAGRRLLHTQTLFDRNPNFAFLRLTTNEASADYHSLQVTFDRSLSSRLATLVSYTWAKSLDNTSQDSATNALLTSSNLKQDRSRSDFDIKHSLTGLVTYEIPAPFANGLGNSLFRNWTIDSILNVRSGKPLNVVYAFPTSFGLAYLRPDLLSGVPLYLSDTTAAGGRRINPAAFGIPGGVQQGSFGRNSLEGFPLYQVDLGISRKFNFTESVALEFQADAFNLLNHPNFEDPLSTDLSLGTTGVSGAIIPNRTFGQSASLVGRSVLTTGGFGSFYAAGGSRALRFSAKLTF